MCIASRGAAVLTLAIGFLLLTVGRYIPAGCRHALWILVAIRLLMPVLPTSQMSWLQVLASEQTKVSQVQAMPEIEPAILVPTSVEKSNYPPPPSDKIEAEMLPAPVVAGERANNAW